MDRKVILYSAASLNSKIADREGSVAWLEAIPHIEGEDYGYQKFYDGIDTTIMGFSTYAQLKSWDIPFPYPDKKNFVITRKANPEPDTNVEFVTKDHLAFLTELKAARGGDIWLVGGGALNQMFLNSDLIDEIIIHLMPVILDGGIDLFAELTNRTMLDLVESKTYSSGVVELHYRVKSK